MHLALFCNLLNSFICQRLIADEEEFLRLTLILH